LTPPASELVTLGAVTSTNLYKDKTSVRYTFKFTPNIDIAYPGSIRLIFNAGFTV